MNTEHEFADTNRQVVEVPDPFAIARWPRDADVATIARCILGTLKYEPHTADTTALRRALESVIDHAQRACEPDTRLICPGDAEADDCSSASRQANASANSKTRDMA
jgi:hypothetical protein